MIVDHGKRFEQPLKVDDNGNMSTTDVLIYTVEANESTYDVYQHEDIPQIGEAHLIIPNLFCSGISIDVARNTGHILKYKANLAYKGAADVPAIAANSDNIDYMIRHKVAFNYSETIAEYEVAFEKCYGYNTANDLTEDEPALTLYDSWTETDNNIKLWQKYDVVNVAGMPLGATTVKRNTIYSFSYYVRDMIDVDDYQGKVNTDAATIIGIDFQPYTVVLKNIKQSMLTDSKKKKYYQLDVSLEYQYDGWGQRLANISFNMFDYNYKLVTTTAEDVKDPSASVVAVGNNIKTTRIYTTGESRYGLDIDNNIATGEPIPDGAFKKFNGSGYGSQELLKLQLTAYYKRHLDEPENETSGPTTKEKLTEALNNVVPTDQELPLTKESILDDEGYGLSFIDNFKYNINYIDFLDKIPQKFDSLALPDELTDQNNNSYNRFLSEQTGFVG